ncbi:MAG: hypothetical protein VB118_12650 [Oscillospiraceae bacterium]|nr:hypothetical protein [Oscillospiraceae bacterium]
MKFMIVALVGMCGAGKSVAAEAFQRAGWETVYFGGVTMNELLKQGLDKNETNEKLIREQLRREYGSAAFAILLRPIIKEKLLSSNIVLDGLYSWSEYKILLDEFPEDIKLLAVVTDREKRYERLSVRSVRPLSPEEARKRDYSEIENLEKGGPIGFADVYITNNGSREEFDRKISEYIKTL